MPPERRRKPVYEQIAEKLKADIGRGTSPVLPSIRELCSLYDVSLKTMSRAVTLLAHEGVVDVSQGRKIRAPAPRSSEAAGEERHGYAACTLSETIGEAISGGAYKVGQVLPKVRYYTITRHLTDGTVCKAFRLLEEKGLIHKRGMKWIVGPESKPQPEWQPASTSCPTVLIAMPFYENWHDLFVDHLRAFSAEMWSQLGQRRMRFQLVLMREQPGLRARFPTERSHILEYVQSLGERYQGTLVISDLLDTPDMRRWIAWFCQFGRPVIWLDHDNKGQTLDRRAIGRANYFRLFGDEKAKRVWQSQRSMHLGTGGCWFRSALSFCATRHGSPAVWKTWRPKRAT